MSSVFLDIFLNNGSRASTSDAKRLRAFDAEGTALSFLGELYPGTVGRQQLVFTHEPHTYPGGRDKPNVKIEIVDGSSLIVHNTEVFPVLESDSILKIVIGEGESLLGRWEVCGKVTLSEGGSASSGEVEIFQMDQGRSASLGKAIVDLNGDYSFTVIEQLALDDPAWNQPRDPGGPVIPLLDAPPIFVVRYKDTAGVIQAESDLVQPDSQKIEVDLVTGTGTGGGDPGGGGGGGVPGTFQVDGTVSNGNGGLFPGTVVQACHLAWGEIGLTEVVLGTTLTDDQGRYLIEYSPPISMIEPAECRPPVGEVSLIVKAHDGDLATIGEEITRSALVSPAAAREVIDLLLDRPAPVTDSEFSRIDVLFRKCLTEREGDLNGIFFHIRDTEGYLSFASRSTRVPEAQLLPFALAHIMAFQINEAIPFGGMVAPYSSFPPIPAEALYPLVRDGGPTLIPELVNVQPAAFLTSVVEGMSKGVIGSDLEPRLNSETDSLQQQWALIRAFYLAGDSIPEVFESDEQKLYKLVLSDVAKREEVIAKQSDYRGTFEEFIFAMVDEEVLIDGPQSEAEDLIFVFEFYALADRHLPIVEVVYAQKAARGWRRARDLTKVTEAAKDGLDGWKEFALAQLEPDGTGFPVGVFGRTDEERATGHARRLFDGLKKAFPQAKFVDQAEAYSGGGAELADVLSFLENNSDFNLETTPVDYYLSQSDATLSEPAVEKLKQLQRFRRITDDFDEAQALLEAGFDSAVAIARETEDEFIAQNEEALGGFAAAQKIHRKAKRIAADVLSQATQFHENLSNSGTGPALPPSGGFDSNVDEEGNVQERFARYSALFGNLFNCGSRHCQTVLSPAAYLVDLLDFAQGNPSRFLLQRRADLTEIELNCANTETVLPYIDLVIEQLSAVVAPWVVELGPTGTGAVDEDVLNGAETNSADLAHVIESLVQESGFRITAAATLEKPDPTVSEWLLQDEHLRFRITPNPAPAVGFVARGAAQTSETADLLSVFPEHSNPRAEAILQGAVFPFQLPLALGRREVELILKQRGLSRFETLRALAQGVSSVGDPRDPDELIEDFGEALVRLSLTEQEKDAILSSDETAPVYWGFSGAPVETIPRPETPQLSLTGAWLDLLAEVGVFLHRSQLRYEELLDLVATEFVHGAETLFIIAGATDAPEEHPPERNARECDYFRFRIVGLDEAAAIRISFFLRLWRTLGWDMWSLDRYLVLIESTGTPGARTPPPDLLRLSQFVQVQERLKLGLSEMFALLGTLDPRTSERLGESLFSRLLLQGPVDSLGYQILRSLESGQVPSDLDAGSERLESLQDNLRIALGISSEDLSVLWPLSFPTGPSFTLTVEQLSDFAAKAIFLKAAGVRASEAFVLFEILGVDPFAGADVGAQLAALNSAFSVVQFFQAQGLSVELLNYLTRTTVEEESSLSVSQDLFESTLSLLAQSTAGLEERYPQVAEPLDEALFALLAEVMPEERIVEVSGHLATLDAAATAFFERYWGDTIAEDATAFTTEVAAEPIEERVSFVARKLRAFLLSRERRQAGLQVAAEAFGLAPDAADLLLQKGLSSTSESGQSALFDWEAATAALEIDFEELQPVLAGLPDNSWTSRWVAAADAEVRFVAYLAGTDVSQSANLELLIGGQLLTSTALVVDGRVEVTFSPVSVRAGEVNDFTFKSTSASALSLRVRSGSGAATPLSASLFVDLSMEALTRLHKASLLLSTLKLSSVELDALVSIDAARVPAERLLDGFPVATGSADLPWAKLREFLQQLGLDRTVDLKESSFFELLLSSEEPSAEQVASLLEVDLSELQTAREKIWGLGSGVYPSFRLVRTWELLRGALAAARKLDLTLRRSYELLRESAPDSGTARVLRENFRAQFTKDAFVQAFQEPRNQLRQAHRDALVGYLTTREITVAGGETRFFLNANDLYGYFLIDVEMEPDTQISRLKLALLSIQLFVERVFIGLEDRRALSALERKKEEWTWMRNFRVWEANRKVFLYPENWIEPQLRDDKTEIFQLSEEELLQEDVDSDGATAVLSRYVDRLKELSDLVVVAMHSVGSKTYVVGRDRAKPFAYYYRSFQRIRRGNVGNFLPWVQIPLEIDASFVAIAQVQGGLRIFWPMFQEKSKVATGDNPSEVPTSVEVRFLWSTQDVETGEWSKPKLSDSRILDPNGASIFERGPEEDGPNVQAYHLRAQPEGDGSVLLELIKAYDLDKQTPEVLGSFLVTAQGEDRALPTPRELARGQYFPSGTVVTNNAAIQAVEEPDIQTLDQLQFGDTLYFERIASARPFRFVVSDNAYFDDPGVIPFAFDAADGNLIGELRTNQAPRRASFITFDHPVMTQITERMRLSGPPGIMNRLTQALPTSLVRDKYVPGRFTGYVDGQRVYTQGYYTMAGIYLGYHIAGSSLSWDTAQRDFRLAFGTHEKPVEQPLPLPTVEFSYGAPYGAYNWELFFHLPMLVADRLSQQMRFEEALQWLHYVFDPKQDLNHYERPRSWARSLPPGARYWNFLPFFANRDVRQSLLDVFGGNDEAPDPKAIAERQQLISDWRDNPFAPHLIARQRTAAYQKFTVMRYLDTLIAWGDQLFRQDSFESINQATQLYVLAAELLGQRPEVIESSLVEPRASYKDVKRAGLDGFSNALLELETLSVGDALLVSDESLPQTGPALDTIERTAISGLFFRIPRNEKLDGYWDTVGDRLFKIRNSMNIDGVKRTLALFQPPIDPALLVRARAAGIDLSSALSQLNAPLPYYRFNVWMGQAKELAGELKSFSSALLSALEKKDAEDLALLRQDHEIRLLKKARDVRKSQLEEAEQSLVALQARRALPLDRIAEYRNRRPRLAQEETSLKLTQQTIGLDTAAGVMNTIAGALGVIPQAEGGAFSFTLQFGGQHLSSVFSAIATAISTSAGTKRTRSGIASTIGGYERRQEDWDLQLRQAELELQDIDEQIIGAEIRIDIARQELENQELQIEQSQEVQEFLQDKFSSTQLYQWMITQLSRTFQEVYRLAYDVAKTAEKSFGFELGTPDSSFLEFEYRDSLRRGLLAGEKLFFDLKRMEVAYLQKDKRELEITKPISLASIDPFALQTLRETGSCEIDLPEVLFDLDFPGQYFRRIRAMRVTIPAVTGPYTNVSAKLSLLSSAVRVKSSADPDNYAYRGLDDPRFAHDRRAIQSIATSTAQDDAGVFELNFRDERYLPFEGAGAVSRWRLELPESARQFDYSTISDVVLRMSYTARDAGGSLKQGATASIREGLNHVLQVIASSEDAGLIRVFSMKREFPDALHQLQSTKSADLTITQAHFPYLLRDEGYELELQNEAGGLEGGISVRLETSLEALPETTMNLELNEGGPSAEPFTFPTTPDENGFLGGSLLRGTAPLLQGGSETWTLTQDALSVGDVDDVLLILRYRIKEPTP